MNWVDVLKSLFFGITAKTPSPGPLPTQPQGGEFGGAGASQSWEDGNLTAALWTIRTLEGGNGRGVYNALVYGGTFDGYADHPRIHFFRAAPHARVTNWRDYPNQTTSAAGAYQETETTYDGLMRKFPGRWNGFGPQVQDEHAVELIKGRGAYDDIIAGRFPAAVEKLRPEWECFVTNAYSKVERIYLAAGGRLATV